MLHKFNPLFSGVNNKLIFYTLSGPATDTFDPSLTTSSSTTIIWQLGDGTLYKTLWTAHGISHTFANLGLHRCVVRGPPGKITAMDFNTDLLTSVRNLNKLSKCTSLDGYGNAVLIMNISTFPSGLTIAYFSGCVLLNGNISTLPSGLTIAYFDGSPLLIGGSIAQLVALQIIRLHNNGWLTAGVDVVLLSASDAIHADVNHFTYASGIALNIGGTNEAPSHMDGYVDPLVTPGTGLSDEHWLWDAGAGKHKALVGGSAIWILTHNTGHLWVVTYNGGMKP